MISNILCLLLGGIVGMVVMALCGITDLNDEYKDGFYNGYQKNLRGAELMSDTIYNLHCPKCGEEMRVMWENAKADENNVVGKLREGTE